MFRRWSADGFVIIVSQITASLTNAVLFSAVWSGQDAATQTKTCFVFHVKSELRSAESEKRTVAYSCTFDDCQCGLPRALSLHELEL